MAMLRRSAERSSAPESRLHGAGHDRAEARYFAAPWGRTLVVMSVFATLCCLGVSAALWLVIPGIRLYSPGFWLSLTPVLLTVAAVPFIVRGYSLGPRGLRIRRLFWDTPIALRELQEVRYEPGYAPSFLLS